MVVYPKPSLPPAQRAATIETLERLARRVGVDDQPYLAEAVSLVLWEPKDGSIDLEFLDSSSSLRLERFSEQVERAYVSRYKGLPPHTV